jgi:fimbrial chaperone protein
MRRSILGWVAAAMLAAAGPASAVSGFGVAPIRMELSAKMPRASFTLTNAGEVPIVVQSQPLAWSQAEGDDRYEDTDAIVVNPPIARIEPGRSQVVRIALRAPPDEHRETAFRMMFTEVPQPETASSQPMLGNLTVVRRMDVPVYVAPVAGQVAAKGHVAAKMDGDVVRLEFRNSGTGHWRLTDLEVDGLEHNKTAQLPQFLVVLPGSKRVVEIPIPPQTDASAIRVRAESAGGGLDAQVPVEKRPR